MAIKPLSQLFLWEVINPTKKEILSQYFTDLNKIKQSKISLDQIKDGLDIIRRRYKYTSTSLLLTNIDNGNIIPIFDKENIIPVFFPSWLIREDGRVKAVVNLSNYSTLGVNDYLELENKKLFTLLQSGLIIKEFFDNENKLIMNTNFIKNLTFAYTRMFVRCLDRQYSLTINPSEADKVSYLVAKFFLLNLVGREDNETVKGLAYNTCVNSTPIEIIKRMEDESDINYHNLSTFIETLSNSFSKLNALTIRVIVETWTKMYGDFTLMGMESFLYFLVSLFSSVTPASMYNEKLVTTLVGRQAGDCFNEFFRLVK
jgi:hypothetical protein